MPEYLSPGVYVEEFESGSKPMEGVGTSTAGFIGLSVKGLDIGAACDKLRRFQKKVRRIFIPVGI